MVAMFSTIIDKILCFLVLKEAAFTKPKHLLHQYPSGARLNCETFLSGELNQRAGWLKQNQS